jgi:phosphoribosylformylglycinamidine synthase
MREVFVEKRPGFDVEACRLKDDLAAFLGPQYSVFARLAGLRILDYYRIDGELDDTAAAKALSQVFSEPRCDHVFHEFPGIHAESGAVFFGVEYLPGQYDQRADSAEQCLELVLGSRLRVRCAKFYIFIPKNGEAVGKTELAAVKAYLVNPVDSREYVPESGEKENPAMPAIPVLSGFTGLDGNTLDMLAAEYGLAMSRADLCFCRDHFVREGRDPTLTELRVLDTYWSDHCRHTTFTTILDPLKAESADGRLRKALKLYENARVELYGKEAESSPRTLMEMATIGAKLLKKRGLLPDLDESGEINACTIKVRARFRGENGVFEEPWLLLFKNETHNHPTEIEPFGGAATCLGGAIRDPLSGRAFVYQAMRISGGGDPRAALSDTLPGKLPQIKIARESAAGYSSYGNQIGLAAGQVAEFYHPGYLAKRMELGAVIAAVPETHVCRAVPEQGDVVLLIGGKTGRDGIGGATGSSKAHTGKSVETAGAEVQKGNAVEERKLQRLFRRAETSRLVKRCNDFGAGGVSVAAGELAAGLEIDLDAVPKKYAGLDGTELAISESQERMAVVVSPEDAAALKAAASEENLDAVVIARVTAGAADSGARLVMNWRGAAIVSLPRTFLDSNGAPRTASVDLSVLPDPGGFPRRGGCAENTRSCGTRFEARGETSPLQKTNLLDELEAELCSLRSGSRRGLQEQFDGTVGAASVLFPWGGAEQGTYECGIAAVLPAPPGRTCLTASLMCFGFDPYLTEADPFTGAKAAVKEALAKFTCLGGNPWTARLSMQEFFERPEGAVWGSCAAALLGALEAQLALGVPAIGGKDSMSGSYRDPAHGVDIAVPPTVVVFAAGTAPVELVRSGALSGRSGNPVILLYDGGKGADEWTRFRLNMDLVAALSRRGLVRAAYPVSSGGGAAALACMAFGSMTGIEAEDAALSLVDETSYPGSVLLELDGENLGSADLAGLLSGAAGWALAARTNGEALFRAGSAERPLAVLRRSYESALNRVYPQTSDGRTVAEQPEKPSAVPAPETFTAPGRPARPIRFSRPLVVLPVFPGTNGEWDMEAAFLEAGGRTRQLVFRNRSAQDIADSTKELALAISEAQILALSGGFSAGDEPDGSGKFIASVLRAPAVAGAVAELLEKQGLVLGICNGFQALIKLGLVPYGRYVEALPDMPVLAFNRSGRHISRMVKTVVMSNLSPWFALEKPGTIHVLPVSHGEGRLVTGGMGKTFFDTGQAAACYAGDDGAPALYEPDNPNGSDYAIEALTSPDGRILGKMGHSERRGRFVHVNIPGNKNQRIFEAGIAYFQ